MTRLHKSMKCAIIFLLSFGFHLFVYSGAANRFRLADAPFCVQQLREAQSDPLPQFQQLIIEHPSDDRTTAVFGLSRCFNRQENNRPSTRQLLLLFGRIIAKCYRSMASTSPQSAQSYSFQFKFDPLIVSDLPLAYRPVDRPPVSVVLRMLIQADQSV
jgi:hypothetical protein